MKTFDAIARATAILYDGKKRDSKIEFTGQGSTSSLTVVLESKVIAHYFPYKKNKCLHRDAQRQVKIISHEELIEELNKFRQRIQKLETFK